MQHAIYFTGLTAQNPTIETDGGSTSIADKGYKFSTQHDLTPAIELAAEEKELTKEDEEAFYKKLHQTKAW